MDRALPPLPPLDRRARRALGGIVAVAALLRLGWVLYGAAHPVGLRDPNLYLALGDAVGHGNGYVYPTVNGGVTAYYPPGYPMALGAVIGLARLLPGTLSSFGVAVAFNLVLSVLLVVLVFELGRRLVGVPAGLIAATVIALWPNLIVHTGLVLTESLFLVLFVAMFLVALATPETAQSPGRARVLTVGLLFGLAGLVRPNVFVLAPLFLVFWWPAGARVAVRRSALVGAVVLGLVAPWTVRNMVRMDAPVLISTNMADNLCVGHHPGATGGYELAEECFAGIQETERPEAEIDRQSTAFGHSFDFMREDPASIITKVPAKLRRTLDHDNDGLWGATSYGADQRFSDGAFERMKQVADAYYYVVAAIGLAGVVVLGLRRDPGRRGMFLIAGSLVQLVPIMLFFGDPRFKMPLYPLWAIGVAVAVTAAVRRRPAEEDGTQDPPQRVDLHRSRSTGHRGLDSGARRNGTSVGALH
jgi:hypothetical protein